MNCSGQFEAAKLVCMVEIMTNLCFVVQIVSCMGRVFDFCYMGMLHDISRELDNGTIGSHIRHNTLHHLKFQDVPITNWPVPLAYRNICIDYCRLVCMKLVKSILDSAFIIDFFLAKIPEIYSHPNCDEKVPRNSSCNNPHNVVLYITMFMPGNLF